MKEEELKSIAFGLHCLQMYEMNVQIELYLATEEFIKVRTYNIETIVVLGGRTVTFLNSKYRHRNAANSERDMEYI